MMAPQHLRRPHPRAAVARHLETVLGQQPQRGVHRRPLVRDRHVPVKKPADGTTTLTADQKTANKFLRGTRALGERANTLLTKRFKALRRGSLGPWRIGAITQAALVLLHHENNRTW
jgi:hypothetical protein